ncbi:12427_t:CDS:1, partial [Cetraspora pellucida]
QRIVQGTDQNNEDEIRKVTKASNNEDLEKKVRRCHKCKQVGHYAPTCPNVDG